MTTIETVDTYIDLLPSFNMSDYNYMERLWAYLSVRTLLSRVERGELYSCQPQDRPGGRHQVCGQCTMHYRKFSVSRRTFSLGAKISTFVDILGFLSHQEILEKNSRQHAGNVRLGSYSALVSTVTLGLLMDHNGTHNL